MRISKTLAVVAGAAICFALASCHGDNGKDNASHLVFSPHAVYDGANNLYVVFYERRIFGGNRHRNVYGQRLGANGSSIGTAFVVSGDVDDGAPSCSTAVYDSQHQRFFVAWTTSGQVFGRIMNADGTPFGAEFVIADTPSCPVAAYDSVNARFLVSWANTSSTIGVFARLINADGSTGNAPAVISSNLFLSSTNDGPVSIAFNTDTQLFLIALRDGSELSAQAVNADGSKHGNELSLSLFLDYWDRSATVLYDAVNKRYVVAWSENGRLRGQFVNPDATLQGFSFILSGLIRGLSSHALAFDSVDQTYLAVFDNGQRWDGNPQVYGQIMDKDGNAVTLTALSSRAYPGALRPVVVFGDADRKFLVLWEFEGTDARFPDIHGRLVRSDGTPDGDIFIAVLGGP